MSQRDILELLEHTNKPLVASEIQKTLKVLSPAISANLKKLREANLVTAYIKRINRRNIWHYERKATKNP